MLIFSDETKRGLTQAETAGTGEFAVDIPPADYAWFPKYPDRYQYVNGCFSEYPGWAAEQEELSRAKAFTGLKNRIIDKRREMNNADFIYTGTRYVSDEPNILGVKSQIDGLPDANPIPTFTGSVLASTWATAENTFTPFTCGEFRLFASYYYSHREKNFTNYTLLTIAATQAYLAGATIAELAAFDISSGWD